jgi:hypothetical protein
MRKFLIVYIACSISFLLLFIFSQKIVPKSTEEPNIELSLILNKNSFHPNETLQIQYILNSTSKTENLTIFTYGILTEKNLTLLKQLETIQLEKGVNTLNYTYSLPSCFKCEGIKRENFITAMMVYKSIAKNSTVKIELVE